MATVKNSRDQYRPNSTAIQAKRHPRLRRILLASAPVAATLFAGHASAATDTWVGLGVDNNWKDPANWSGDAVPIANDVLAFDGANRLSTNDNYTNGTIFGGFVFNPTAAGAFTLAGNSIQLNGNITDNTQSFTHTISLPMTLDATPTINIAQNGSLLVSGIISGGFGVTETGLGLLTLSGTNAFTGPLTVGNGATLAITTDLNLGAAPVSATPGDLVLDGGSQLNTTGGNFTLNVNRDISIVNAGGATPPSAAISIATGQTVTYDGVIADGGTAGGLTKLTFGNLVLGGVNTYTGPTNVMNGGLNLDFTQATAPVSNIISSSSALSLGGATAGLGQISNATLMVIGKAATNNIQSFASTNINIYGSVITSTAGAGGTTTINLGSLTHTVGGTVVIPTIATGTVTTTTSVATTNGILGGWAVTGTPNVQRNTTLGTDWATVNGSGQIVAYTGYVAAPIWPVGTGTESNTLHGSSTIAADPNKNVKLTASATSGTYQEVRADLDNANTTTDINTFAFTVNGASEQLVIGTGNTLRLGVFGGIFKQNTGNFQLYLGGEDNLQSGNGSNPNVGSLTAGGPNANTPGEIVLTLNDTTNNNGGLNILASIVNNGTGAVTLVKTGSMSTKIDGHNTYSGGTFINQGRFQLAGSEAGAPNPDGLGSGAVTVAPGAYLYLSGINSATIPFTGPGAIAGAIDNTAQNAPILNNFVISGNGDSQEGIGAIRLGNRALIEGQITLGGNARIGGGNAAAYPAINSDGTTLYVDPGNAFTGQITGAFSLDLGSAASVATNFRLDNPTNNWSGGTNILNGGGATTVRLGASNVIPAGVGKGNLTWADTSAANLATVDLNGLNLDVNGLSTSGTASANLGTVLIENDGFTPTVTGSAGSQTYSFTAASSTLTVGDNNQTATFGGVIRDSNTSGNASSTITLPALNGVAGTITVTSPWANVTSGSPANIALVKIGSGIQTLSGANTYSGNTTINGGAISVTGSLLSTANVFVNTSASAHGSLYGTGSVGNVTLAASTGSQNAVINPGATGFGSVGTLTANSLTVNTGADLQFDLVSPGASDSLHVLGAASFAGASTVSPGGGGATGTYTLLTAASITGTEPTLNAPTGTRSMVTYDPASWNPTTNASATSIVVDVITHAANLTWTGAGDGATWDVDITKNWLNTTPTIPVADFFFNGDNVTFDDTAAPNYTINLPGNVVSPNSITFNNTSGSYSITGTGSIAGVAGITKNGTGTLSIATANTFTGANSINAGRVLVNNFTALGTNTTTGTTIASGAALDISGDTTANDVGFGAMPFTIAGTGTDTNGVIVNNGVNQQNAFTSISLSGDSTIGGSARFDIRSASSTLNLNNFTLTKVGAGQFSLVNTIVSGGNIVVNGGELSIEVAANVANAGTTAITMNTGTTLQFFNLTGGVSRTIDVNGTGVVIGSNVGAGIPETINSAIVLSDPVTIATLGGSGTLQLFGLISETSSSQSITKTGANLLYLNQSNTYSGGTTVTGGGIELGNTTVSGATITSGPVGLGTLTLGNGTTLQDDANLRTLANNVSIGGNVTFDPVTGGGGITLDGTALATPATVTLTASPVLTVNANITINDAIVGGANSLTVATAPTAVTPGILILGSPNNSWSGGTTVRSGTLQLRATGALPSGTSLTLGNTTTGGTLDLGGANATVGGLATAGTGTNQIGNSSTTSSSTLTFSTATSTFSGNILNTLPGGSMSTALTVASGSLTLSGANTYAAGTTVNTGATLVAASTTALPTSGNIANSGALAVNANSTVGNVSDPSSTGVTTVATGVTFVASNFSQAGGLVNNGSSQVTGSGTVGGITGTGTMTIGNGATTNTVQLSVNSGGSTQSALTINTGAVLDITNNHLIINYGTNPDPITTIQGYLVSGFNNGTWNGPGINSSTAAATSASYGVGYADAADPGNPAGLASGTIEVEYTLLGDADLNRIVNGIDFGILAANFNKAVTAWDQGDFNYDNIVNGIDFGLLAANFNKGASGADAGATPADFAALDAFAAQNGLLADVPEPASAAILLAATGFLAARRRRRA